MEKKVRIVELDSLRGLAALAVVFYHYTTRYQLDFGHIKKPYLLNFEYGSLGVQLFFIISGFVIFMTLLNVKSLFEFIYKRMSRLYPAYIFAVILTATLVHIFILPDRMTSLKVTLINLTMLEGFMRNIPAVDGVYWTLTVELAFYILMGFIYVTKLIKKIEIVCIAQLLISFLLLVLTEYFHNPILSVAKLILIPQYCNLFIAGIFFYKLKQQKKPMNHVMICLCLVYQYLFYLIFMGFTASSYITIAVSTCFFIIFYLLIYEKLGFLRSKYIMFLGTISYSLYLIHQYIGYMIIRYIESLGLINEFYILIPVIISIGIATFITFIIEKPIQKVLKNKYNNINGFYLSMKAKLFHVKLNEN